MYSHRISHLRLAPKNIDYWDYSILCHGDDAVARVLQRFEYWDGTKAGGNVHGEETNDQLQAAGQKPTQDVTRYVYKTVEELAWELLGSVGERTLPKTLDMLCDQLGYLKRRNNPYSTFDHTKQYEFQETLVVAHLARLQGIVEYFLHLGRRQRPVLYAIEQLTKRGVSVAHLTRQADGSFVEDESKPRLSLESVAGELRAMHTQMHCDEEAGKKKPSLPRFVRSDLVKDELHGFGAESDTPHGPDPSGDEEPSVSADAQQEPSISLSSPTASRSGKFAETNPTPSTPSFRQNCRNSTAHSPDQRGGFAETIPVITSKITPPITAAVAEHVASSSPEPAHDAAAAAVFEPGTLSLDKIALVLAHRVQLQASASPGTASEASPQVVSMQADDLAPVPVISMPSAAPSGLPDALCKGNEPPRVDTSPHDSPSRQPARTPDVPASVASDATMGAPKGAWTAERLLALFEAKRGTPYDPGTRARQLAATARMLAFPLPSGLRLPSDAAGFGACYAFLNDRWTQDHYGEPTPTYLMEPEKASGQPRLVRLLARFSAQARALPSRTTTQPTPEQLRGERPLVGISGRPVFVSSGAPLKIVPPPPRATHRPGRGYAARGG